MKVQLRKHCLYYQSNKQDKYDFSNDYENLANISREIDSNKEEIANLETYRKELSKWLNIKESLGNLKAFKTAKFFLGTVAKKNFEPLKDKLRNS